MLKRDAKQPGAMIQAYVRTRWGDATDVALVARSEAGLEPELRNRIDILGFDAERLLNVDAAAVLIELEKLEQAAAREDARVAAAANRIRAREVNDQDAASPARRDPGMHPGRPRQAAGHGRRRQRGQR